MEIVITGNHPGQKSVVQQTCLVFGFVMVLLIHGRIVIPLIHYSVVLSVTQSCMV